MFFSPRARQQLGKFLREKREQANYSQTQVAQLLGYTSGQYVSNWERGLSLPPSKEIWVIAKVYQIPKKQMIETLTTAFQKSLEEDSRSKKTR